jgi:hypothetical protein
MGPTDGGSRRLPFIGWSSKGRFAEYGLQWPKAKSYVDALRSAGMMHEGMASGTECDQVHFAIIAALATIILVMNFQV